MKITEPVHKLRFMAMALAQGNRQKHMTVAHYLYPVTHIALNNTPADDDWIAVRALRRAGITHHALDTLDAKTKTVQRTWIRRRYHGLRDTPDAHDILTAAHHGIAGPTDTVDTVDTGHVLISAFCQYARRQDLGEVGVNLPQLTEAVTTERQHRPE
ncbi:hypothetical protein GCM10012275_60050 [Longimycelium tulufanense]|uniref:Uncharacterized protein n=1 Tax=Longimycelium tulufanense TaxID=907463 RepID=A0A8J3CE82_9PSEU|nr:hypothetical protein [Longimycelium tulufanense]GGM81377.1 hypothetical protein GCM10012275_60050 [Longimycelium tulufanense]